MTAGRRQGVFRIGAIAERFAIHPQTLRLYEREGLLRPVRSEGKTRLYDADTIERLEIILTLTRDLGVNLAGVEVILHMKEKIERMQGDVHHMLTVLREEGPVAPPGAGPPLRLDDSSQKLPREATRDRPTASV
jgi:MerR family transcriptional regulator/heat shock protein HspR